VERVGEKGADLDCVSNQLIDSDEPFEAVEAKEFETESDVRDDDSLVEDIEC
jgi:hypothetical protein